MSNARPHNLSSPNANVMKLTPPKGSLLAAGFVLFTSLAVGLPIALQSSTYGAAPTPTLLLVGLGLLLAGLLFSALSIARAASLLGSVSDAWTYGTLAVVFWPVGTTLVIFRLWDRCSESEAVVRDRIQISAACLFLCALGYFSIAWSLYERGETSRAFGLLVGVYGLAVYWVMVILAVDLKRWAWRASNIAFLLHLGASVLLVTPALQRGPLGALVLATWAALGTLGLWANLRSGSRVALVPIPTLPGVA